MAQSLMFHSVDLRPVRREKIIWLRGTQIADALGYRNARQRIQQIYDSHADEFTPNMTRLVRLKTGGGFQQVRVFSLRGAHLLAMFSRTPVAKEFRRWVLDILDREAVAASKPALPPPSRYPLPVHQMLPAAQTAEILACLDRLGKIFNPLSDQFSDVVGVRRALSGLHPKTGQDQRGYAQLIPRIR